MDDNDSSEDEDVEVIFIGIDNKVLEGVEGMVDLEAELVSSLEELGKYKRMYKKLKIHMTEHDEENNYVFVDLKN